MSGILAEAVAMAKRPIKIVYVKETQAESLPAGGIDLEDLISTDGEKIDELFEETNGSPIKKLIYISKYR